MATIQVSHACLPVNSSRQVLGSSVARMLLPLFAAFSIAFVSSNSAYGAIKFFDGFGDADLDNDGTPLEPYDVDAGDDSFDDPNGANTDLSYVPERLLDPNGPTNPEVTSVLDAQDVGLKWFQMRGFTGANDGRSKPTARIVDDTQGAMLETMAAGPGALGKPAINTGYAVSYNSRGRGSSMAAFFGENVALGPEQGDSIRVSFDFRIWRDAPALNTVIQPEDAELRFGLYQDTDDQLGMTNGLAGRSRDINGDFFLDPIPAVWGEEEGWFEGQQIGGFGGTIPTDAVGAPGDAGWFGAVILEDPAGQFPPIIPNGGGWRIREESNTDQGGANDVRILQGTNDVDTVAVPQDANPPNQEYGLTNLNVNKVWHLSLELVRDMTPDGAAITANLSAYSLDDPNTMFTLSGTELTNDPNGDVTTSVDNFDYFAIRNTGIDDYDFLLDNFALEIFGSNVPSSADFDDSGIVDGLDFLRWQRGETPEGGSAAELALWESQYGGPPPLTAAVGAVPEPASALLALAGIIAMGGVRYGAGRAHQRR